MPKTTVNILASCEGSWPNGEPQSVRDAADQKKRPGAYDVYMVVIGGYDAYDVVAVYAERRTAGQTAREYNETYGCPGDVTRWARVEEISFYPDKGEDST